MNPRIDENRIIAEARKVILLLENGKEDEANKTIDQFDEELSKQDVSGFTVDVIALWEQVGIAASNMSNLRYFEDIKEEFNRVTFEHSKRRPV